MTHVERVLSEHLHYLCETIGARPAGSPANERAAAYIAGQLAECGFRVEHQPYACPVWEELGTTLSISGERVEAAANAFAPPCDVAAPTVPVATLAELRAADVHGRVAVLYGQLTAAPIAPKAWPYKGEVDEELVALLEQKRPAAILTVQAREGRLPRLTEDAELRLPAATVPAEVGLGLVQRPGIAVRLRINSACRQGTAANIVGRIGNPDQRVVICAHFDTKIDTPGAADNASGVAVLLALGRLLAHHPLQHGLELVAFNGEESLPIGDEAYLERSGDRLGQIVALLNFDAVGLWLAPNGVTALSASAPFEQAVRGLLARHPGAVWAEPWIESNHGTFAWRGVPCVALTAASPPPIYHTRGDDAAGISPARLREALLIGAETVALLQAQEPEWSKAVAQEVQA